MGLSCPLPQHPGMHSWRLFQSSRRGKWLKPLLSRAAGGWTLENTAGRAEISPFANCVKVPCDAIHCVVIHQETYHGNVEPDHHLCHFHSNQIKAGSVQVLSSTGICRQRPELHTCRVFSEWLRHQWSSAWQRGVCAWMWRVLPNTWSAEVWHFKKWFQR